MDPTSETRWESQSLRDRRLGDDDDGWAEGYATGTPLVLCCSAASDCSATSTSSPNPALTPEPALPQRVLQVFWNLEELEVSSWNMQSVISQKKNVVVQRFSAVVCLLLISSA